MEKIMQGGSAAEWFFSLPQLLSFLSHVTTLEPDDVVAPGTADREGLVLVFQQSAYSAVKVDAKPKSPC
jgi:2-keto-4-pentenoate hydratase/2-oxohepta-3-ene-1,7-dioic acid hydratase in catechol pathway